MTQPVDIVERLRKPMVSGLMHPIDAERAEAAERIERLEAALEMIAGTRQCLDNLMSDKDIARRAL